jgi:hypothetical protein
MSADKSNWDKRTKHFALVSSRKWTRSSTDRADVKKRRARKRVSRDQAEFRFQTPTLIVNGEVIVGAVGFDELKTLIEAKLKAKDR